VVREGKVRYLAKPGCKETANTPYIKYVLHQDATVSFWSCDAKSCGTIMPRRYREEALAAESKRLLRHGGRDALWTLGAAVVSVPRTLAIGVVAFAAYGTYGVYNYELANLEMVRGMAVSPSRTKDIGMGVCVGDPLKARAEDEEHIRQVLYGLEAVSRSTAPSVSEQDRHSPLAGPEPEGGPPATLGADAI
jgi:hypothetical protein